MKKQETITPELDEIVFEKRNKMYGAYNLRKMYNKQVIKALLLSIAIMMAGLAFPLVSSYKATNEGRYIPNDSGTEVIIPLPPDAPPLPPPPSPPVSDIQKQIAFRVPEVVLGEALEDVGINMDDLNQASINIPIEVSVSTTNERQPDLIPEPIENQKVFTVVEEMPSYPGGETERIKFLAGEMNYPQKAVDAAIQGTVYVQFVVDSKGNISNAKIIRGIGGGCDEEAIRVIKLMKPWHPGKQNGLSVPVLFTMPVVFKLQN